jgi:hypothetical protein
MPPPWRDQAAHGTPSPASATNELLLTAWHIDTQASPSNVPCRPDLSWSWSDHILLCKQGASYACHFSRNLLSQQLDNSHGRTQHNQKNTSGCRLGGKTQVTPCPSNDWYLSNTALISARWLSCISAMLLRSCLSCTTSRSSYQSSSPRTAHGMCLLAGSVWRPSY